MSDSGSEQGTPADPVAPSAQKKVSGLLVVALFLIVVGAVPNRLLFVPIIGPIGGLILALVGKKRVRLNPLLIGPRFANAVFVAALLGIVANVGFGILIYNPWMMQSSLEKQYLQVFQGLLGRDNEAAYQGMDESYRSAIPQEEFTTTFSSVIPGTDPVPLADVTFGLREEALDSELESQFLRIQKGELTELEFTMPWRLRFGEVTVDLDMDVWVHRIKWGSYEAKILGMTHVPGPPADTGAEPVPDGSDPQKTPPGKSAEDAPEDEPK